MATFVYKAKDRNGQTHTGQMNCASLAEAKARLARARMKPISIKIKQDDGGGDDSETPILGNIIYRDAKGQIQIALTRADPTAKEIIVFTKQFATMIGSGVSLIQALTILGRQQSNFIFRKALKKIQADVEGGAPLSVALAKFPIIFDALYVAMVEAGEASGNLDTILVKLATYISKADKIKGQVKSAMVYPAVVIVVAIVVVAGMLAFVVPALAQQFAQTGRELPGITLFVLGASDFFVNHYGLIAIGLTIASFLFRYWVRTEKGRAQYDDLLLKIPGLGDLLKKIAVGRFCSTMASLLSSGVNLLDALTICAASAGNKTIENFVYGVRSNLEKGEKFSKPLGEGNLFPEMVVSMVAVGEATGALDDMLNKVSEFYEEEVDLAVQTVLAMIEPLMIVWIGGIVGFIVIAMYLPIFSLAGGI